MHAVLVQNLVFEGIAFLRDVALLGKYGVKV